MTSGETPTAGSCCILLAGTNDIAVGEPENILKGLEQQITSRIRTANVIVSNLPHRHDLPRDHLVNQQTVVANDYIRELCKRLNVTMLDFNSIQRRWFTRHGMHLRMPGKQVLAGLMLRCLERTSHPTTGQSTSKTTASTQLPPHSLPDPPSPGPITLAYSNFAEAVKQSVPQPVPPKTKISGDEKSPLSNVRQTDTVQTNN